MRLVTSWIGEGLAEVFLQIGVDEASQRRIQAGVTVQPRVPVRFRLQGLDDHAFLKSTEVLNITLKNRPKWIPVDDLRTCLLALGS